MLITVFSQWLVLAWVALAAPALQKRAKYDAGAMNTALKRGSGILGSYSRCSGAKCAWMGGVPDDTKITDLSVPGTHDSASWNYTPLTQIRYLKYTGLIYPSPLYKCGKTSIFTQLSSGIRAFDLRVGFAPNGKDLVFFHSEAVLDTDARFEDIVGGMWRFLDENPSETLFVSVKVENTTWGSYQSAAQSIYSTLTSSAAQAYVNPTTSLSSLTLSNLRGKMVLLRRFAMDGVPGSPIGLSLYDGWADNSASFSLAYADGETAYIEDLYEPSASLGLTNHVQVKLAATTANVQAAGQRTRGDGLYVTFASSEVGAELLVPEVMAQGLVIVPGVNQGLKKFLTAGAGRGLKKKGIIFADYATETSGLIDAIIA
ncbi:hypothetical protein IAU60_006321 [Kwoniella sp. DSM 27419]